MFKEEDLEAEAMLVQGDQEPVILNRLQAQLYALGSDPDTFLSEPHPDDQSEYQAWKCDLDKRQGEISDLMVNNSNIRKNYSTLVPEKVTHKLFWTRYFFKVHLIELQENKRQMLKKRIAADEDEEINWDDVADLAEKSTSDKNATAKDIPTDVQDKLLKETSSDDWEKLSSGEKSPRKTSKEE